METGLPLPAKLNFPVLTGSCVQITHISLKSSARFQEYTFALSAHAFLVMDYIKTLLRSYTLEKKFTICASISITNHSLPEPLGNSSEFATPDSFNYLFLVLCLVSIKRSLLWSAVHDAFPMYVFYPGSVPLFLCWSVHAAAFAFSHNVGQNQLFKFGEHLRKCIH